jgi:pyruvate ferredoxin oxidoreductase gamma subunit
MGAPAMSFCRIEDKPICTREPVTDPDALLILDPTLLHEAWRWPASGVRCLARR